MTSVTQKVLPYTDPGFIKRYREHFPNSPSLICLSIRLETFCPDLCSAYPQSPPKRGIRTYYKNYTTYSVFLFDICRKVTNLA